LQADEHVDRRRRIRELQARFRAAEQIDELVVNDLDDRLTRRERLQHVGADGALFDRVDEIFGNREVDVGFEQRDAHFAQYLSDVRLGETAAIRQPIENSA
jgi:hypothetical protein